MRRTSRGATRKAPDKAGLEGKFVFAQNKPRPFLAHRPGGHESHPAEDSLRGGVAGVGLGLDGGDAGLAEGQRQAARTASVA